MRRQRRLLVGQLDQAVHLAQLAHLAVERIRQHRKGEPFLVAGKNKEIVMTLREIAAGKVTFDNIHELPKQRRAEKVSEPVAEDDETEE